MKYSIIIPTFNKLNLLKPCLESIISNTNLSDSEIIIISNGCKDGTPEYIKSLNLKLLEYSEPLGYTKAVNEGLKIATGEFIILLNNDIKILVNNWIEILSNPFKDKSIGITGPLKFGWNIGGIRYSAIAFWCCMFRRELLNKIGLLDEQFNPGMGEDGDFCIRTTNAGYKLFQVPVDEEHEFNKGTFDRSFPIYHEGNGTFGKDNSLKESIIVRNNRLLEKKWGNSLEHSYIY
jgi:GT2 family glycosyltransferase